MASRLITDLDLALQPIARAFLDQDACRFLTQTYRSSVEQDADYAQGRTVPGHIITDAKGGQSPHNCTLPDGTPAARAFDFGIWGKEGALDWNAQDDIWQEAIAAVRALKLISGSSFHGLLDNPHAEMPNWKTAAPILPQTTES